MECAGKEFDYTGKQFWKNIHEYPGKVVCFTMQVNSFRNVLYFINGMSWRTCFDLTHENPRKRCNVAI